METKLENITIGQYIDVHKLSLIKNDNEVEQNIEFIHITTGKSIQEIEEMDMFEFRETLSNINIFEDSVNKYPLLTEINIDSNQYKSTSKSGFTFNVKQISLLSAYVKKNPTDYIDYLAAVIFKNVDKEGNIINDYSEEGISIRAKQFRNKLTMDIITPYLHLIIKHIK